MNLNTARRYKSCKEVEHQTSAALFLVVIQQLGDMQAETEVLGWI